MKLKSKIVIGHYKDPKTWQEFNYCLEVVIAPLNDEDAEDAGFVKIIGNINSSTHIDGGAKYFDGSYFWIDRKGRSMNASNLRGILHECGFKIIMTSKLGETGKDGASWDKYYLTIQQREGEADRFKSPRRPD